MVQVRRSTIINAPVDQVWAIVRDFNGHDRWHPAVADSALEDGRKTDMIGAVRSFHLESGEHLREQLLALSDHDLTFQYCIIESPIPLLGYVATVRLIPVTDTQATYWEWSSEFETPPGQEDELAALVGDGVYTAGFEAIRTLLTGSPAHSLPPAPENRGNSSPIHAPLQDITPAKPDMSSGPSTQAPVGAGGINSLTCSLDGYGGPERFVVNQRTVPAPADGEVRIRQEYIGLNYIDVYCRTGLFDLVSPDGGVPGLEAAGVITEVGRKVTRWRAGDRVAYATLPTGSYTEVRNMDANRLVQLPDDITSDVAAATLVKGLTAHFLLHEVARVSPGDYVLVHAAAGGVGLLLCQWANHLGAQVIGTVGNDEKRDVALAHGCRYAINYSTSDFADEVANITNGGGASLVVDGVGQATFARSLQALAVRGHLVSYGQASGEIGSTSVDQLAAKSITLSRPNFGHYTATAGQLEAGANRLFDMIRSGALRVTIGERFALRDVRQAHEWLESRRSIGANLLVAGTN